MDHNAAAVSENMVPVDQNSGPMGWKLNPVDLKTVDSKKIVLGTMVTEDLKEMVQVKSSTETTLIT